MVMAKLILLSIEEVPIILIHHPIRLFNGRNNGILDQLRFVFSEFQSFFYLGVNRVMNAYLIVI